MLLFIAPLLSEFYVVTLPNFLFIFFLVFLAVYSLPFTIFQTWLTFSYVLTVVVLLTFGGLPNLLLIALRTHTGDCSSWYVSTIKNICSFLLFSVLNTSNHCMKILKSKWILCNCVISLWRYLEAPLILDIKMHIPIFSVGTCINVSLRTHRVQDILQLFDVFFFLI